MSPKLRNLKGKLLLYARKRPFRLIANGNQQIQKLLFNGRCMYWGIASMIPFSYYYYLFSFLGGRGGGQSGGFLSTYLFIYFLIFFLNFISKLFKFYYT